ncbi:restriction endonuclease subunit S [Caproiciproducens sp.]
MKSVKLGTILNMEKGKKPAHQAKKNIHGYMPYVNIKAFETGVVNSYTDGEKCTLCDNGDILIVCDGSRSGLVGRAIKGAVGSTLAKVSARGLISEYFFYFLQGQFTLLNTRKKGTGTPHVNPEILKNTELVVPDEKQQRLVVAKIEELFSNLDASVTELQTAKKRLKIYRQAVLKQAFSSVSARMTIRESTSVVTSGSRGWAKYYSDQGAIFVRIGNLTRTGINIDLSETQHIFLPDNTEGTRTLLQEGDVLVSITADLGSIGLIPSNFGEAYINQHIALVRFRNKKQSKLFAWYLRSEFGQADLLKNKRGEGKLGLGLDDIRDSHVPNVDDEEASRIIEDIESRLSVCDKIEKTVDESLQQTQALRQSILKKAFDGKLA